MSRELVGWVRYDGDEYHDFTYASAVDRRAGALFASKVRRGLVPLYADGEPVVAAQPERRRRVVWCGHRTEFLEWCHDQGVNPNSGDLLCLDKRDDGSTVRGLILRASDIVRIGTWFLSEHRQSVEDHLRLVTRGPE